MQKHIQGLRVRKDIPLTNQADGSPGLQCILARIKSILHHLEEKTKEKVLTKRYIAQWMQL